MSKGIKLGLGLFIIGALVYVACRPTHPNYVVTEINETAGSKIGQASEDREKTIMLFNEMTHDFGFMKQGDVKEYAFQFKNNGNVPLVIETAKGSCGCTVPEFPKEAIAPGGSGYIKVKFDSKGKVGPNNKKVTIIANTTPISTVLEITAQVAE
jgi:hypothetical protein